MQLFLTHILRNGVCKDAGLCFGVWFRLIPSNPFLRFFTTCWLKSAAFVAANQRANPVFQWAEWGCSGRPGSGSGQQAAKHRNGKQTWRLTLVPSCDWIFHTCDVTFRIAGNCLFDLRNFSSFCNENPVLCIMVLTSDTNLRSTSEVSRATESQAHYIGIDGAVYEAWAVLFIGGGLLSLSFSKETVQ